jgi:hypothetical protein
MAYCAHKNKINLAVKTIELDHQYCLDCSAHWYLGDYYSATDWAEKISDFKKGEELWHS